MLHTSLETDQCSRPPIFATAKTPNCIAYSLDLSTKVGPGGVPMMMFVHVSIMMQNGGSGQVDAEQGHLVG